MDKYRLKKWVQGANIQIKSANEPTIKTIVELILDANSAMTDALVPLGNRTIYMPTKMYQRLKQNPDFISVDALGKEALARGVVGMVDGCPIKQVPKGYLPKGVYFMIKYKGSTVDPVKMKQYDVLKKVQGYAGPVVQGVTYYDSFVLGTKGDGIAVCGDASLILVAPALTIASHAVTAAPPSGAKVLYTTDGTNPRYSATAQTYTSPVTLKEGETFKCISVKDGCVGMAAEQAYQ